MYRMKATRKNQKKVHRKRRHTRKVGGINWKFWEKKPAIEEVKPPLMPEVKSTCPPCPICDSVVHVPPPAPAPLPMPASLPAQTEPLPASGQAGGKRRRKSKKNKSWFQIGCKR